MREEREVEKNPSGQLSDAEPAQVNCREKKAMYDDHWHFVREIN